MHYVSELYQFMGSYLGNIALLTMFVIGALHTLPALYDDFVADHKEFMSDIKELFFGKAKGKDGHF